MLSGVELAYIGEKAYEIARGGERDRLVEDYLTGILISEMVQVLKVTESNNARPKLPHAYTNSFDITLNNAKACE